MQNDAQCEDVTEGTMEGTIEGTMEGTKRAQSHKILSSSCVRTRKGSCQSSQQAKEDKEKDKKKENLTKERTSEKDIEEETAKMTVTQAKEEFETFRRMYPGRKRGMETELKNLQKKCANWTEVVQLFRPAVKRQLEWMAEKAKRRQLVPEWPMLSTWINNRRWEDEGDTGTQQVQQTPMMTKAQQDYRIAMKENEEREQRYKEMEQRALPAGQLQVLAEKASQGDLEAVRMFGYESFEAFKMSSLYRKQNTSSQP